jgi:hypothetical protein
MTRLEEIMERLMRLCRRTSINMRDSFPPGPNRWYISQSVHVTAFTGGYASFGAHQSGSSPEEAAEKYWAEITGVQSPDFFLCRTTCKPDVNIPGDTPQVWVRWNHTIDDWEDVLPTEESLKKLGIPADRIIPWKEQYFIDHH